MDGFCAVEVDEEEGGRRVNKDSRLLSLVQAQHRRSKRFSFPKSDYYCCCILVYVMVIMIIGL